MQQVRLARSGGSAVPALPVIGEMALRLGRVHELCGPARRTLAAMVAARTTGPVLWIRPAWTVARLNPEGLLPLADPGRLILIDAPRPEDLLWCAEEALRAGVVPLILAEMPAPPALTPVRRLHLAAESGAQAAPQPPLGLLLTEGAGGSAGVESRWWLAGAHGADSTAWRLERRRDRSAPPAAWRIPRNGSPQPLAAPVPG